MISIVTLCYFWIFIGVISFLVSVVLKIDAPYGRHFDGRSGLSIPNKWGWVLMELPALLFFPLYLLSQVENWNNYLIILLTLWIIHYFHRSFIYPFKIKTAGKKIPLAIVISAFIFNIANGYFVGVFTLASANGTAESFGNHLIIGLIIFFLGMYINIKSDYYLISLREENKGYQIPKGGMFNFVSCPNHLGEIIEWIGFAIIAWNLGALSFALWTFLNLAPRSFAHHKWYQERFLTYPKDRKAVIPYLI